MKLSIQLLAAVFLTLNCVASTTDQQAKQLLSKQNEKGLIENQGQMMDTEGNPVPFVLFKTEAPGVNLWITEQGMTMQTLQIRKEPLTGKEQEEWEAAGGELSGQKKTKKFIDWERIDLTLKGASIKKENIINENPMQGHTNYFYPHCPDGIYGVKEYQKVTIKNVYPNIDWVIYRTPEHYFKYDFVVHPGGDYHQIELVYHSKIPVVINEQGQLTFTTNYGDLQENKPVSFYEDKEVATKFIQNYQRPTTIHGDKGFETSIGFHFSKNSNLQPQTSNLVIDPQLVWATFYGGFSSDYAESIDVDTNGNLFITGSTWSTNFPRQNPFSGAYFQGVYGGNDEITILKFNNNGNRLWATYYGGSQNDRSFSIKTDASGNVFVTGFTGSSDLPVQNSGTYFQGYILFDIFILKFNNNGNRLWATFYGGSDLDDAYDISIDIYGNIYITGLTNSTDLPVQNTGTFFQGTLTNPGYADVFILKFDNNGNRLWATYYGGSLSDIGIDVETDNTGNVFITGYTTSTDFPLQNSNTFYQSNHAGGLDDIFIIKFDNVGNRLWGTYYGGNGGTLDEERPSSIITDSNGNLFVVGYTFSTNFPLQNVGTFFQGSNAGLRDMFILKFDNIGTRLWATFFGGNSDDLIGSLNNILAIDNCDNIYLSFMTNSTNLPVIASGLGSYTSNYHLGHDGYIARFSNVGNLEWATYWGGDNYDMRGSITVDKNNNLFIAGEWANLSNPSSYSLTNPGNGAYFDGTYNGGFSDMFIAKFISDTICLPPIPTLTASFTPSSTTVCQGDGITFTDNSTGTVTSWNWTFNGGTPATATMQGPHTVTFTSSGTFNITLQVGDGVSTDDTTIVITVNPTTSSTDLQTSCDNFTWINGITYTTSTNIPKDTLVAANGCDSVVTLNLTINNSATSTDIQTACDSYTWINGITYTTSTNTPKDTLVTTNGCDSVVTLNLIINNTTSLTQNFTECQGFNTTVGSNVYNTTGNYVDTLTAISGCDSIVTTNLTIIPPASTTQTFNECEGFSITVGANIYSTTGNYTDVLNGCDTVITNLTINPAPQLTLIKTDDNCDEQTGSVTAIASSNNPPITYNWNTGSTDSIINNLPAGLYSIIIVDNNNCMNTDSVLVLNITTNCEPTIFIPNVFSPNGDNHNDLFMVQLVGLEFESLQIYNRWGILLFQTESRNEGWDGRTTTGEIAADGTYFYILNYKDKDEKQIKKGTLTLIR